MTITDDNFKSEVEDFGGLILVDFWAEWCGPCKMLEPIVAEIESDYQSDENVKIGKLNVDENPGIAQKFGVMSIPTLIVFKGGEAKKILVGVKPKQDITDAIEEVKAE